MSIVDYSLNPIHKSDIREVLKSLCKGLEFKKAQTKTVAMQIPRPYSGRTKRKKKHTLHLSVYCH